MVEAASVKGMTERKKEREGERERERKGTSRRAAADKSEVTAAVRGWGRGTQGKRYIRNLILISPQFNYSADKSCTCTA